MKIGIGIGMVFFKTDIERDGKGICPMVWDETEATMLSHVGL